MTAATSPAGAALKVRHERSIDRAMEQPLSIRRPRTASLACALAVASVIAGCGGGGEPPPFGLFDDDRANAHASTRTSVHAEAAGANCMAGGVRIDAGLDVDGNGVLDAGETTSVQFVCHGVAGASGSSGAAGAAGAAGATGMASLVRLVAEPAGANCAAGGTRIDVGRDADGDGVLDAAEVTSSDHVCAGSNGASGSNGVNGSNGSTGATGATGATSLIAIVAEPAGANCAHGGSRVRSGVDADGDAVLDPAEVTATSYVCHGAPGAPFAWVEVTTTAAAMQANRGYLANSATPVTLTLPAAPAIGDVVRVNGAGTGGWTIAQNAGQQVVAAPPGLVARESSRSWLGLAASADGTRLLAGAVGDRLYTSSDAGATWTPRESVRSWVGAASSADGVRLVASDHGGDVYTSSDGGATWTPHGFSGIFYALASSADGTTLIAGAYGGTLHVSTDAGATWTPRGSVLNWNAAAMSADGTKAVAVADNGEIHVSTDAGATWAPRESVRNWRGVAMSADGTHIVAGVWGERLYVSHDGGATWTARESTRVWHYVAMSADGSHVLASSFPGRIYRSRDHGDTWTPMATEQPWSNVAMSSDGASFFASTFPGQIHVYVPRKTTVGTGGSVSGLRFEAIDLQYIGGGVYSTQGMAGEPVFQ